MPSGRKCSADGMWGGVNGTTAVSGEVPPKL
jgi:hypothetical protein